MCRLKITSCISERGHGQSVDHWITYITFLADVTERLYGVHTFCSHLAKTLICLNITPANNSMSRFSIKNV